MNEESDEDDWLDIATAPRDGTEIEILDISGSRQQQKNCRWEYGKAWVHVVSEPDPSLYSAWGDRPSLKWRPNKRKQEC